MTWTITPIAGAGTISIDTAGNVTGVGTAFNSSSVGATIIVGQWAARVATYTSATSVTLDRGPDIAVTGQSWTYVTAGTRFTQSGTDANISSMYTGSNGVRRLVAGEWTRYEVPHQLQINGTFTQNYNEQLVMLQRTNSAYDTSNQIQIASGGKWIWGNSVTSSGVTKYRETIPLLFGQSGNIAYGEQNTTQVLILNGGSLEWYNTKVKGSVQNLWVYGSAKLRDVVFDRQGLIDQTTSDSQWRINGGATVDIDGLTIIGGKFFILATTTSATFLSFKNYKPTMMLRGVGFAGVPNSYAVTDGTVSLNTAGRLRLDDFAGEGNARDCGIWAGGLVDFYNPKAGCGITVGPHLGNTQYDTGYCRVYGSVQFTHKNAAGTALQNIVSYMADNPTSAQSPYTAQKTYAITSNASGVSSTDVLMGWRNFPTFTQNINVNPIRRSVNQTDDVYAFYHGGYEVLPFSSSNDLVGTGTKSWSYTNALDGNITLTRANAITKLASSFTIDVPTKTITVTANSTYDDLYDVTKYFKFQGTAAAFETPTAVSPLTLLVTPSGSNLTAYTGWTLVVNAGVTLSEGSKFTYVYFPTITNNGSITGIYASAAGTSTIWRFDNIQVGSSIVVYDSTGVTKYFQGSVTSAGDYNYYIPPGTTGTYYWAIEKYGKQRESGSFAANTGGLLFYAPLYVEDVGISVTTQSTVAAYTAIDNLDKFYDYTAYRRLSEDFIKIGQIATRSGTAVEIGNYNLTVNAAASVMEAISGLTITIKSGSLAPGSKYSTIIATPPRLVTAATTEVITAAIEDGAGDSSLTIQGGSGNFTLWKLANATPDDDYATGTNLGNVGNVTYRFLSAPGYKIIIRDNTTAYRINCPMDKGIYTRGLFFGDQVQLAQSAEVTQINTKVDILTNNVAAVPAAVLASTVETGATVVESLRLHNSVLGGIVSGAGTGTETFRDLADTKDRLISSVDANGNRTAEVADLT